MSSSIQNIINDEQSAQNKANPQMMTYQIAEKFNAELLFCQKVIRCKLENTIQDGFQTDGDFIEDLLKIREQNQKIAKKRKQLEIPQALYHFVEKTGQIHYQANIANDSLVSSEKVQKDKCPCGCQRSKGQKLPYCTNIFKKYFFGEGVILFFYFNIRTIFLVLISAIVYGIYSLVTNLTYNQSEETCINAGALTFLCQFKNDTEISNKQSQQGLMLGQLMLGLLMCFIWSVGMKLMKRLGSLRRKIIDQMLRSASDCFIFMQRLPIGCYSQRDILEYLNNLWNRIQNKQTGQLKIKGVQIIYDMSQFRKKIKLIRQAAQILLSCFYKTDIRKFVQNKQIKLEIKSSHSHLYSVNKKKLIQTYESLLEYRTNFMQSQEFRKKLTSECALVEFEQQNQQMQFLKYFGTQKRTQIQHKIQKLKNKIWQDEGNRQYFMGNQIIMYEAPEPSDIFWGHCEKKCLFRNTVIVWLLSFVLTGCSFGFLYLLRWISLQNLSVPGLPILRIIAINLFNRIIWHILQSVILYEKNYTKTINIISVMNKSYVSQTINTIIIPIILSVGISGNIHGPAGLAGLTYDFQITAFAFMVLFNLINVPYRIKQLKRCIPSLRRVEIRRHIYAAGQVDNYNEIKQALTYLYDPPKVPIAGLYVYITTIIAQAFFFCHLNPMLLFFLIGNLIFFFLINQYMVIRRCKIADMINVSVFYHVTNLGLNIPLFYGVATIIFLALSQQQYNFGYYVPSILCFIVWLLSQSPLYQKLIDCIVNLHKQSIDGEKGCQHFDPSERSDREDEKIKRIENYYSAVGTNQLFNMENKLQEVRGPYHGKLKQFCQQFNSTKIINQKQNPQTDCQLLMK